MKPWVHKQIVKEALGDGQTMSDGALQVVMGHVITGAGNLGSDIHQWAPERHFDNAPDRETIIERWQDGLDKYLQEAVDLTEPVGEDMRALKDRAGALRAFGKATHALEDFYAHTNWIEIGLRQGIWDRLAPINFDWELAELPADIQSGYFSITNDAIHGRPPEGYQYAHWQINKDQPGGYSDTEVEPDGPTYYEAARYLATRATKELWNTLQQRIAIRSMRRQVDPDKIVKKLAWGGDESCVKELAVAKAMPLASALAEPPPLATARPAAAAGLAAARPSWEYREYRVAEIRRVAELACTDPDALQPENLEHWEKWFPSGDDFGDADIAGLSPCAERNARWLFQLNSNIRGGVINFLMILGRIPQGSVSPGAANPPSHPTAPDRGNNIGGPRGPTWDFGRGLGGGGIPRNL